MERGVKKITVRKNRTIKGDLRMKEIHEDDLLIGDIVKKINDFLIKNSFKEKIKTEIKKIIASDGNCYVVFKRYFITNNCNGKIYLDTVQDVANELLGFEVLKKIIENN